ncbi:hypothetical protein PR048_008592 [Dryococelus australis]|uniref:Uncharacterized protein n=1 Tax=Dryococelus australis TaxID=614101 RepID=A0ABQ9HXK0_9NEOP|nr:hypothetical protein PR048_008592 [Dryococelus australis]
MPYQVRNGRKCREQNIAFLAAKQLSALASPKKERQAERDSAAELRCQAVTPAPVAIVYFSRSLCTSPQYHPEQDGIFALPSIQRLKNDSAWYKNYILPEDDGRSTRVFYHQQPAVPEDATTSYQKLSVCKLADFCTTPKQSLTLLVTATTTSLLQSSNFLPCAVWDQVTFPGKKRSQLTWLLCMMSPGSQGPLEDPNSRFRLESAKPVPTAHTSFERRITNQPVAYIHPSETNKVKASSEVTRCPAKLPGQSSSLDVNHSHGGEVGESDVGRTLYMAMSTGSSWNCGAGGSRKNVDRLVMTIYRSKEILAITPSWLYAVWLLVQRLFCGLMDQEDGALSVYHCPLGKQVSGYYLPRGGPLCLSLFWAFLCPLRFPSAMLGVTGVVSSQQLTAVLPPPLSLQERRAELGMEPGHARELILLCDSYFVKSVAPLRVYFNLYDHAVLSHFLWGRLVRLVARSLMALTAHYKNSRGFSQAYQQLQRLSPPTTRSSRVFSQQPPGVPVVPTTAQQQSQRLPSTATTSSKGSAASTTSSSTVRLQTPIPHSPLSFLLVRQPPLHSEVYFLLAPHVDKQPACLAQNPAFQQTIPAAVRHQGLAPAPVVPNHPCSWRNRLRVRWARCGIHSRSCGLKQLELQSGLRKRCESAVEISSGLVNGAGATVRSIVGVGSFGSDRLIGIRGGLQLWTNQFLRRLGGLLKTNLRCLESRSCVCGEEARRKFLALVSDGGGFVSTYPWLLPPAFASGELGDNSPFTLIYGVCRGSEVWGTGGIHNKRRDRHTRPRATFRPLFAFRFPLIIMTWEGGGKKKAIRRLRPAVKEERQCYSKLPVRLEMNHVSRIATQQSLSTEEQAVQRQNFVFKG